MREKYDKKKILKKTPERKLEVPRRQGKITELALDKERNKVWGNSIGILKKTLYHNNSNVRGYAESLFRDINGDFNKEESSIKETKK